MFNVNYKLVYDWSTSEKKGESMSPKGTREDKVGGNQWQTGKLNPVISGLLIT